MAHVFVSYVREDQAVVNRLCQELRAAGIVVWLDKEMLLPGQRWQGAIQAAIESGSFFLACFSANYSDRNRTYMNEELNLAVDELRKRPRTRSWFIPALLSDCRVPDLPIGAGETLRDIQSVGLYFDWDAAIQQLVQVLGRDDPDGASPLTTVMLTDLAGSSRLLEALMPDEVGQVLNELTVIQRSAVHDNHGVDLGVMGESVLASFKSADTALRCASQIQEDVSRYVEARELAGVQVKIGLHTGNLFEHEGKVQGNPTHIVARICSRAEPGSILISGSVEERIDKHTFRVESRNTAMLKGIATPIQLFTVRK